MFSLQSFLPALSIFQFIDSLFTSLIFFFIYHLLVVILDEGAVKAFGTYDELRRSGVDIDDFVVRATEEELAEELNNAAQIVEKNPTTVHNKETADGKSLMREVMIIASIIFFPLSSLSLSLYNFILLNIKISFIFPSCLDAFLSLFLSFSLFLSHCPYLSLTLSSHSFSLSFSVSPVIPTAEVAATGKKSTLLFLYFCVEFIIIVIR